MNISVILGHSSLKSLENDDSIMKLACVKFGDSWVSLAIAGSINGGALRHGVIFANISAILRVEFLQASRNNVCIAESVSLEFGNLWDTIAIAGSFVVCFPGGNASLQTTPPFSVIGIFEFERTMPRSHCIFR